MYLQGNQGMAGLVIRPISYLTTHTEMHIMSHFAVKLEFPLNTKAFSYNGYRNFPSIAFSYKLNRKVLYTKVTKHFPITCIGKSNNSVLY